MSFTISAQLNAAQSEGEKFQQAKRELELERLRAENRNIVGSSSSASKTATPSVSSMGDLQERLANLGLTQQEKLMGLSNKYRTLEGGTQGQVDEQAFRRQTAESETRKYLQGTEIGSREKMQARGFDNVEQQRSRDATRAQGALRSVRSSGL